jgi:hypothetical protein
VAVEEVRARLRRKLVGMVGMEEADLLLGPPGGWDEVVTRELLHLELAVIETRLVGIASRLDRFESGFESRLDRMESGFDGRLVRVEHRLDGIEQEIRAQTGKVVAAMAGLLGALVVAIKL